MCRRQQIEQPAAQTGIFYSLLCAAISLVVPLTSVHFSSQVEQQCNYSLAEQSYSHNIIPITQYISFKY